MTVLPEEKYSHMSSFWATQWIRVCICIHKHVNEHYFFHWHMLILLFHLPIGSKHFSPDTEKENSAKEEVVAAPASTTRGNADIHKRMGRHAWGGCPEDKPYTGILITSFTHTLRVLGSSMQMICKGHDAKRDIYSVPNSVYKQEKQLIYTARLICVWVQGSHQGFASKINYWWIPYPTGEHLHHVRVCN